MRVEVVYALPGRQTLVSLDLEQGTTAAEAVALSGIRAKADGFLAIFGRRVEPEQEVREGDRVEILRPLAEDPKEARRRRARRR